jgi:peptidyl-prolyl cis-trans isomerase D
MLKQIRAASKSWLALVFIIPLIIAFAVWGLNDVFGGGLGNDVVRVGKSGVSMTELRREVEVSLDRESETADRVMTMEEARAAGLVDQAVSRLASIATYVETARAMSLRVSDDLIRQLYREIEVFKDPVTNEFDANRAMLILRENNLSDLQFEKQLIYQLYQEQIGAAAAAALRPPATLVAMRQAFLGETRQLTYVSVPFSQAAEIKAPDESQLQSFFTERADLFANPERRNVTIVRLSLERFRDGSQISADDVQALYQAEIAALGNDATRDISIFTFADRALGAEVITRLNQGQPPEFIASELTNVTLTRRDNVSGAQIRDVTLREQAAGLGVGGVSAVFEGGAGYQVIYVSRVVEAEIPTFETLEARLRSELIEERAAEALFEALNAFEQGRDEGMTMRTAAEKAGVALIELTDIDQNGLGVSGQPALNDPAASDILRRAFSQAAQLETETVDLGDAGYFALEVSAVTPRRERTLDEAREDALLAYEAVARINAMRDRALLIEGRLREGALPADLQVEFPDIVIGQGEISRLVPRNEGIDARTAATAFGLSTGQTTIADQPSGGLTVIRVDGVGSASELIEAFGQNIEAQLSDEISSDLAVSMIGSLQREFEVATNRENINAALGLSDPT